jgi:putative lipoic acid-binding regulatory protein
MSEEKDTVERQALLQFPCQFPIKIMGRDHTAFHDAARSIVSRHADDVTDEAIRQSASRKGNFAALTITIEATSQQQLDDIYRDLSSHEEILVAL